MVSRMCDQSGSSYSPWDPVFFHHYLQQHARLSGWMLNLHQNDSQDWQNPLDHQNHACHHDHHQNHACHHDHQNHVCCHNHHQNHVCHHNQHQRRPYIRRRNSRKNSRRESHHRSDNGNEYNAASVEYVGDSENDAQEEDNENSVLAEDNENDVPEEQNEDEDSDGEWVFNAEPFLAFRAASEAEKMRSEEKDDDDRSIKSIELVDAVLDENFEFIQLDDFGRMQKVCDRPSTIDATDDREYDKAARTVIYGDRADRIAGLETSLEIMFDHINDLHEPIVYPIV